ncbi:MAG: N utilization substance protein B [bacterium]|jgi:N utilization substance protein B
MGKSSRRQARELAVKIFYQRVKIGVNFLGEALLYQEEELDADKRQFCELLVQKTWENLPQIDQHIQENLINWKQSRLSETLNTLLRLSIGEILYLKTDGKVVLNEALEICREYVDENAVKICNGLLNAVWKKYSQ